ncbi:hypothetical protein HMPREF9370_0279 [Neisseria wadsworthii 9715]|uniref:Uncharacterized protein n=1 Tax=Neisseria wadsworthii 9715 TaxID=1030841 RepID=G4CMH0_9NEIS|nr:hypothetical protein HMPREF9370_0279 [Neisseria wadsworthii 9715]
MEKSGRSNKIIKLKRLIQSSTKTGIACIQCLSEKFPTIPN